MTYALRINFHAPTNAASKIHLLAMVLMTVEITVMRYYPVYLKVNDSDVTKLAQKLKYNPSEFNKS